MACSGTKWTKESMTEPMEGQAKNSKNPIPSSISRVNAGTIKPRVCVVTTAFDVQLYPFLAMRLPLRCQPQNQISSPNVRLAPLR